MSKRKRNIILIFGFILALNFLFFPCNQIEYSITYGWPIDLETTVSKSRWVSADYWKVFFPLIKSRANKYKEYVKWESLALLTLNKEIRALENTHKRKMTQNPYAFSESWDMFNKKFEEIYGEKKEELNKKFGHTRYYHQIKKEFFSIEPVLLILFGLFGSLMLRKIREWREDRIKRRKAGIILSLIGVGVLAGFLPLFISVWDEGVITLLSIAGITLFLVGIGLVIFSFFPEDANPKKKD